MPLHVFLVDTLFTEFTSTSGTRWIEADRDKVANSDFHVL